MTRTYTKPTGKPSWPITLIAGAEKTGKSYAAALAAASDLIGDTYWIGIGEDRPDEYGLIADFNIVEHDGTYRDILAAITEVAAMPKRADGKQILLNVDSMTRLWDLIKDNKQAKANARARRAATKYNRAAPDGDSPISMDLWNEAATEWNHIMTAIRAHQGPSILTARLDTVTVMDDDGKPTKQKQEKVSAQKSLPFDVGAVIEMPARGETYISGVRSVRLSLLERTRVPDFTMDLFWRKLGLHDTETSDRTHDMPVADVPDESTVEGARDWAAEAGTLTTWTEVNRLIAAASVAKVDGELLNDLRTMRDALPRPDTASA